MNKFRFLTPSKNAEKVEVYEDALNEALEDKDVKNIAISGSYGAGKSSFLKTFESKKSTYKFLDISLATFQKEEKDISLIEKSILQQIFYKVEQKTIPQSKFKRINTIKLLRTKSIFLVLFLLSYFIFFDSKLVEFLFYPRDLKWIPLLILLTGLFYFFKSLIQNFTGVSLEKLNLQNLEIETNKESESSLLNKYLDEMLYFFSQTDFNVVVFQDLDRFDNLEIFTKLREINNFLNNSEQVKKRHEKIVFLYAIKDDIFKYSDGRTKFFDFTIPIIPYINSSTSYDKLLDYFEYDLNNKDEILKPKKEFLRNIALYIQDMRLLYNIYNEYIIYDKKIGKHLDKTKLLAMIVYKNFYPDDFSNLNKDTGIVNNIFKKKSEYIKEIDNDYSQEINNIHNKIKEIENESHILISELRTVYVYKIIQRLGNVSQNIISVDSKQISINHLTTDENFSLIMRSKNIMGSNYHYNIAFNVVEQEVSQYTYQERVNFITSKNDGSITKLHKEINIIKKKQKQLVKQTLEELSQKDSIKELIKKDFKDKDKDKDTEDKELLKYLIFSGNLDENYYLYLSHSFNKSLTVSDTEFLKNVINNNALDYYYKLTNIKELTNKLQVTEFAKKSILNYDLLNFLIENEKTLKDKYEVLFEELSNGSEESIKFIFSYINFLPEINHFIVNIAKSWTNIWKYIYENIDLTKEEQEDYLYLFLYNLSVDDLYKLNTNNLLKKYIENLTKLRDLVNEDNEKFKLLISKLNVKFHNLSELVTNRVLFAYIYDNNNYELNKLMIEQFVYVKYAVKSDIKDELYSKHLTTIKTFDEKKKLIVNIEQNISSYIDNIFLQLDTNTEESEDTIVWLLNNENLGEEQKTKITEKQNTIIDDISKIQNKDLLDVLFIQNKVNATWKNIGSFYNYKKELDDISIKYLSVKENAEKLSKVKINTEYCEKYSDFDFKILQDILETNKFDNEIYIKLVKSNSYCYSDLDICSLGDDKIDILIDNGKLQLTTSNIMLPFVKTSKLRFLIPQTYDTCDRFSPLESKLLTA